MKKLFGALLITVLMGSPAFAVNCGANQVDVDGTCYNGKFAIKTKNYSGAATFEINISAKGTFTVNCGDGGTLSGEGVSGNTIERTTVTGQTYQCSWSSGGAHIITLDSSNVSEYSDGLGQAAVTFDQTGPLNCKVAAVYGSLGSVFPTLNDGSVVANKQPKFFGTFNGCTGLTSIPSTLFNGVRGAGYAMFEATFKQTSITSVPSGLFADISGAADVMFNSTFALCTDLTTVPANLFAGVSGTPKEYMFFRTFSETNLTNFDYGNGQTTTYIPENFFGSIASTPDQTRFMEEIFYDTHIATECPGGATPVHTDWSTNYWSYGSSHGGTKVSCPVGSGYDGSSSGNGGGDNGSGSGNGGGNNGQTGSSSTTCPILMTSIGTSEEAPGYAFVPNSGGDSTERVSNDVTNYDPDISGISHNGEFVVDYGSNKGKIHGYAGCSTRSATHPFVSENDSYVYVLQSDGLIANLPDNTGNYCYCQLDGYTANGSQTTVPLSAPWVYHSDLSDSCMQWCSEYCARYLAYDSGIALSFRSAVFNSVSCESNTPSTPASSNFRVSRLTPTEADGTIIASGAYAKGAYNANVDNINTALTYVEASSVETIKHATVSAENVSLSVAGFTPAGTIDVDSSNATVSGTVNVANTVAMLSQWGTNSTENGALTGSQQVSITNGSVTGMTGSFSGPASGQLSGTGTLSNASVHVNNWVPVNPS